MFDYNSVQDKIGVPIKQLRGFEYWFGVSVGVFIISALLTLLTGSLMVWMIGLTVSVCAWLLDVSHRRLTYDSWRPHVLFWPSMGAVIILSGGIVAPIVLLAYAVEYYISN